jgi:putative transposase
LFSHNTKAKLLNEYINSGRSNSDYIKTGFRYIHNNPVKDNLVEKYEDWEFSSFKDYAGLRNGNLINRNLAAEIINYDDDNFYVWSLSEEKDEDLRHIF